MSLLQFNKECPKCQHDIAVRLNHNRSELDNWICPSCENALLFVDFSFTEKELLAIAAGQTLVTAAHSVRTNHLLEAHREIQISQLKTLNSIHSILFWAVTIPFVVGFFYGLIMVIKNR